MASFGAMSRARSMASAWVSRTSLAPRPEIDVRRASEWTDEEIEQAMAEDPEVMAILTGEKQQCARRACPNFALNYTGVLRKNSMDDIDASFECSAFCSLLPGVSLVGTAA
jgi:hypothetical protein